MTPWKRTKVSIPNQGKTKKEWEKENLRKCIEKEIMNMDRIEEVKERDYLQCWRV